MSAQPEQAPSAALEFLLEVTPPGAHGTVVAIDPKNGACVGIAYTRDSLDGVSRFIAANKHRNLYWTPNPLKHPVNKKPKKGDVATMAWVHLDLDDPSPEALAGLRAYRLPPTIIIFSGGGYQAFWQLREPVTATNENTESLEAANKRVAEDLGGDPGTWNLDRIMRLPGTTNWPTVKKLEKGRTGPVPACVVEHHETRYTLDEFGPPAKVLQFPTTKDKDTSDSADLFAQVGKLLRAGKRDKEIKKSCANHPHVLKEGARLGDAGGERAIQRCIDHIRAEEEKCAADAFAEVNAEHSVIRWVGQVRILSQHPDPQTKRPVIALSSVSDMNAWYANRPRVGKLSFFDAWFNHPDRSQYKGVVFEPNGDYPGYLNLWRGWGVKSIPGDCSLFLAFVLDVICKGVQAHFLYVLEWLADAFQNPTVRPGVMLVLRGAQGTGKGTFARTLGKLYGDHFLHIRHTRHLTGNFNAHLANVLLLFADEAYFPGDKAGEGALKGLVTEPTVPLEMKGKDVISVSCHLRIIMASNNDWVVPADGDDRRSAVFDVSADHAQDTAYFGEIDDQMKRGGYEALLHYLLNYKLGSVDLRKIPDTDARREQQEQSLDSFMAFWRHRLQHPTEEMENDHGHWVETDELCKAYRDSTRYHPLANNVFTKRMRKLFPKVRHVRGTVASFRDGDGGDEENTVRRYGYQFPPLVELRQNFAEATGREVDWEGDDDAPTH